MDFTSKRNRNPTPVVPSVIVADIYLDRNMSASILFVVTLFACMNVTYTHNAERVKDSWGWGGGGGITHILRCHLMSGEARLCICTTQMRSPLALFLKLTLYLQAYFLSSTLL